MVFAFLIIQNKIPLNNFIIKILITSLKITTNSLGKISITLFINVSNIDDINCHIKKRINLSWGNLVYIQDV